MAGVASECSPVPFQPASRGGGNEARVQDIPNPPDFLETDPSLPDLMRKAQAGDSRSYETALREISRMLRPFLRSRLRDPDAQEDLLQEILLSVHRARHTYDSSRPFAPWLHAITRYRLIDYLRGAKKRNKEIADDSVMETLVARDFSPSLENMEFLKEALFRLPENQRRILELTILEGRSPREAAAILNISSVNARVISHRARRSLGVILKELGYEDGRIDQTTLF